LVALQYPCWHGVCTLAALALDSAFGILQGNQGNPQNPQGFHSEACLVVYAWTLVAPKILPDRNF